MESTGNVDIDAVVKTPSSPIQRSRLRALYNGGPPIRRWIRLHTNMEAITDIHRTKRTGPRRRVSNRFRFLFRCHTTGAGHRVRSCNPRDDQLQSGSVHRIYLIDFDRLFRVCGSLSVRLSFSLSLSLSLSGIEIIRNMRGSPSDKRAADNISRFNGPISFGRESLDT